MDTPSYLIIPGWNNSGPGHWQTIWEENAPRQFRRVEQHNWTEPTKDDWVQSLHESIELSDRPVVLVAHSLGCLTVVHWAKEFPGTHIVGALLVAPADVESTERENFASFAPVPKHRLPFPTLVVASTNDPYAPIDKVARWAAHWGSKFVSIGNTGHINAASKLGLWQQGLDLLARLAPVQQPVLV